ncbi:conserved protein of unknown function [Bradyrhizobium vignae]|uniref:Uncharacterized protein n=1 Tax=Bradyrhizobium vignae TaxID=1549949 RepID=A0A2U3PUD9_9BRAD|nr:conserved protein of unknown function [Bradyrhizobium vignae]
MPIDFKLFRKLESLPSSLSSQSRSGSDKVEVLVKLRRGARRPVFVTPRTHIGPRMFSAEITFDDMKRLEVHPSVESMSLGRKLPQID